MYFLRIQRGFKYSSPFYPNVSEYKSVFSAIKTKSG